MLYNLNIIKEDLKGHRRNKRDLEKYYINKRLNESLSSYSKQLEYSIAYLNNRKAENVIKEM